jgi:hypothetical protein
VWWYPAWSLSIARNDSGRLHWRDNWDIFYRTKWWYEMISRMSIAHWLKRETGTREERETTWKRIKVRVMKITMRMRMPRLVRHLLYSPMMSLSRDHFSPFFSARDFVRVLAGTSSLRVRFQEKGLGFRFPSLSMRVALDVALGVFTFDLLTCDQDSTLCYRCSISYVSRLFPRFARFRFPNVISSDTFTFVAHSPSCLLNDNVRLP